MSKDEYLFDTNILIYHTQGFNPAVDLILKHIQQGSFHISILTKIEFLGWDKHTPEGYKLCKELIDYAVIFPIDDDIAETAIDIKRNSKIKLIDATIAATAIINDFSLVTRNTNDFKGISELKIINPF